MSARVWSTESCRCAAMSARSASRARAARSSPSSRTSRSHHGASTIATPPSTATDATAARTIDDGRASCPTSSTIPTSTSTTPPAIRRTPAGVRPPALGGVELAPRERGARERDEHGDDPRDLDVDPGAQRHEQRGAPEQDDADRDVAHGQLRHAALEPRREARERRGPLRLERGAGVAGRDGEPPEDVERDPGAAREPEEAHDEPRGPDGHVEVRREPRAHAADPAAALGAAQ